jgi:hypothetical protein
MKMAARFYRGDQFIVHPEIDPIAKVFVRVPDTKIWLTNPAPGGFLRWQGRIVLPTDPLVRMDLLSDNVSGPAESVNALKIDTECKSGAFNAGSKAYPSNYFSGTRTCAKQTEGSNPSLTVPLVSTLKIPIA